MKIIDISWPISESMTTYKNNNKVVFKQTKTMQEHGAREAQIILNTHTGTHIDAPAHFLQDGKTIDKVPLDSYIGPCRVIDVTHVTEKITVNDLQDVEAVEDESYAVLLKTRNSALKTDAEFCKDFVYLDASAALYLVECGVTLIGFDYLGIERNQPAHETHKWFLEADIPIVEGLRLQHVKAGFYFLVCLPLALVGLEAAPARAVLVDGLL